MPVDLPVCQGVTFASQPTAIYVPVREASNLLGWSMTYDPAVELITLKGKVLDPFAPQLSDGTWLISLEGLKALGAHVSGSAVKSDAHRFVVALGPKRVRVDLKAQRLWAWQGSRLVYSWPVSSGREGKETPNGDFKSGTKEPMHISTIYGSPMPYSVHVTGNIYIHGSAGFTTAPGSHGCIRLPLMERRNVAEEFYNWIEPGTPVSIRGAYEFAKKG
jgi:lipoprotein-anchoring transpeptidase ErfK/SrfK